MAQEYIIEGPELEHGEPQHSISVILLEAMQKFSHKTAFVNGLNGLTETFGSFRNRCISVADNLSLLGVGAGDNVSIYSRNHVNVFASAVGTILIGASINGLDVGLAAGDLKHLLALINPKAVFCEMESLPTLEKALSEINLTPTIIIYGYDGSDYVPFSKLLINMSFKKVFKPVHIKNLKDATAAIVCSSGSSGLPKAVKISHYSLVGVIREVVHQKEGDHPIDHTMLIFSSLYWISGLFSLINCLKSGYTRIYLPVPFSEKIALETIQEYKPTLVMLAPSMCNRLVKFPEVNNYDLSSIRLLIVGGSKASPEYSLKMDQLLPNGFLSIRYGLTEFSGGVAANMTGSSNFDTIGKLLKGISGKVINLDNGASLGPNKIGELYFKGKYVMQGYYNNPNDTAAILDKDGWVRTGDLGYYDDEHFFYVTDRIKEVLKFQNYPICPAEVEAELIPHPDVIECGVVGVPHEMHGDILVAFVIPKEGSSITEEQIKTYVDERVSDAKRLRGGVVFVEDIPLLPSGKINRKHLKNLAYNMKNTIMAKAVHDLRNN